MNKPVAWGVEIDGGVCDVAWDELELADIKKTYDQEKWDFKVIPLYTHTVKELTDEEISEVMSQCDWQYCPEIFAKAILRKAQDK